jgi:hypothetical protein
MRTVTKSVYQFDELSDAAKETAREWFRTASADDEFWEATYADADSIAKLMGIEIDQKPVQTMGGTTRYEPAIFFTGFSSQGDGACFEGRYSYAKGGAAKVRTHAPVDEKLHAIADGLQAVQKAHGYKLYAKVKQSGHYSHSGCTDIEVMKGDDCAPDEAETEVKRLLRAFMDWIYRQLETEYEYQNEDEQVDENIRANEYEFEADGRRTRD